MGKKNGETAAAAEEKQDVAVGETIQETEKSAPQPDFERDAKEAHVFQCRRCHLNFRGQKQLDGVCKGCFLG